jgi:hypothetical protein
MNHNKADARPGGSASSVDRNLNPSSRQKEIYEMKQWAENLRLNTPLPRDLLPLLSKDGAKQMEILLTNMSLGTEEKKE